MRTSEKRLAWIEHLVNATSVDSLQRPAVVIPSSFGDLAVAFPSVVEIVSGTDVQPFALMPNDYCGVVFADSQLVPVIDAGSADSGPSSVLLTRGNDCLLGLLFAGVPRSVSLGEFEDSSNSVPSLSTHGTARLPRLFDAARKASTSDGSAWLLDIEDVTAKLLS